MDRINISDGEWKLMKLLWESAPRTIGEMVDALREDTGWSKTTIFVMLNRLIVKDAVRMEEGGRAHLYYPEVTREEIAEEETESFLTRVYDGSVGMMVSALAERNALSKSEIDELRTILDELSAK